MFHRLLTAIAALSLGLMAVPSPAAHAVEVPQHDISGPPGSGEFGRRIEFLANDNLVVIDALYDAGAADVGAVSVYSPFGALLNTITGSGANDQIGSNGIRELENGSFVIVSPHWSGDRGAVTLCQPAGCSGQVSAANSLVGGTAGDVIGGVAAFNDVFLLPNGAYLVTSSTWHNGATANAGMVTWCPSSGCVGVVSGANSLVGTTADDFVSFGRPQVFESGAYVVATPSWNNGFETDAGAVTWCPAAGCVGPVSAANSLIGSRGLDQVGTGPLGAGEVTLLTGGAYVVSSPTWDNGALVDVGAATWCPSTGCFGPVSPGNSLIGGTAGDNVPDGRAGLTGPGVSRTRITELTGGGYVVTSTLWDNGTTADVGAATACPSTGCVNAVVSAANSLTGSTAGDHVGLGVTPLLDGRFIVGSPDWDNGLILDAGAATQCQRTGCAGVVVSAANSLVGSTANDGVGGPASFGVGRTTELDNGTYVIGNPDWDSGVMVDAGAVTWCPAGGCTGTVSAARSLVGSTSGDQLGFSSSDTIPLSAGRYVVASPRWANGGAATAGAVTWCPAAGCAGTISPTNSLVGSATNDAVGSSLDVLVPSDNVVVSSPAWKTFTGAATFCIPGECIGAVSAANSLVGSGPGDGVGAFFSQLSEGRYAMSSPGWTNGAATGAGAVTWCAATGCTGTVSPSNSLVGTRANDNVGGSGVVDELVGGAAVVIASPNWDNGAVINAGAVTWCTAASCVGAVTTSNSLFGATANDFVGENVRTLLNGDYLAATRLWDNGAIVDAGAVTVAGGSTGEFGPVTTTNSVVGRASNFGLMGTAMSFDDGLLGVGFPSESRVVLGLLVSGEYTPLVPARLLDTRPVGPGIGTVDGQYLSGGVVPGGTTLQLQVAGRGGVPNDAKAVALNVTVTEASQNGFLTVFPCGVPIPTASSLNYDAAETVPNAVLTKLGTGGTVCLYVQRTTHLIVDVNGEFPPTSTYTPLVPARLLDTRSAGPGIGTIDGLSLSGGVVAGGTTLQLQVGGRGGVALDAKAAALNVTVTEASEAGFLTVFPCGIPIPTASNLNYVAGDTVPNAVISELGTDGTVCFFAQRTTHLIVDVNGDFPATSSYTPLVPARLLDTRPAGPGISTIDGLSLSGGVVTGGTTLELQVGGRGGVRADARAVMLNVTVTEASEAGFLTVFPCGVPIPTASNLNYVAGGTVPNAVLSKVGTDGKVCLFAQRTTHLIVDVNGVM